MCRQTVVPRAAGRPVAAARTGSLPGLGKPRDAAPAHTAYLPLRNRSAHGREDRSPGPHRPRTTEGRTLFDQDLATLVLEGELDHENVPVAEQAPDAARPAAHEGR